MVNIALELIRGTYLLLTYVRGVALQSLNSKMFCSTYWLYSVCNTIFGCEEEV